MTWLQNHLNLINTYSQALENLDSAKGGFETFAPMVPALVKEVTLRVSGLDRSYCKNFSPGPAVRVQLVKKFLYSRRGPFIRLLLAHLAFRNSQKNWRRRTIEGERESWARGNEAQFRAAGAASHFCLSFLLSLCQLMQYQIQSLSLSSLPLFPCRTQSPAQRGEGGEEVRVRADEPSPAADVGGQPESQEGAGVRRSHARSVHSVRAKVPGAD